MEGLPCSVWIFWTSLKNDLMSPIFLKAAGKPGGDGDVWGEPLGEPLGESLGDLEPLGFAAASPFSVESMTTFEVVSA